MSLSELLLYCFTDSLLVALLLPIQDYTAILAVKAFHSYSIPLVIISSFLGLNLAVIVNVFLGKFFMLAFKIPTPTDDMTTKFAKISKFFRKYLSSLLIFAPFPIFGALVVVFFGAISKNLKQLFLISLSGNLIYLVGYFYLY